MHYYKDRIHNPAGFTESCLYNSMDTFWCLYKIFTPTVQNRQNVQKVLNSFYCYDSESKPHLSLVSLVIASLPGTMWTGIVAQNWFSEVFFLLVLFSKMLFHIPGILNSPHSSLLIFYFILLNSVELNCIAPIHVISRHFTKSDFNPVT